MNISRRRLLYGAGALASTALAIQLYRNSSSPDYAARERSGVSLDVLFEANNIATKKGYVFGSAVHNYLFRDSYVSKIISQGCNTITPESAMKLHVLRPKEDVLDIYDATSFMLYAQEYGLDVRGHTLCWHASAPDWYVEQIMGAKGDTTFIKNMAFVLESFRGRLQSWDVVNEVIKPQDGKEFGFRDSFLFQRFGRDFVLKAFNTAAQIDPSTPKYLCEYFGSEGEHAKQKIYHFKKLIDWLIENDTELDGIGLHGHIVTNKLVSEEDLYDLAKHINDAGLDLLISELDVRDYDHYPSVIEQENAISSIIRDYLSIFSSFNNYSGIVNWGMFDTHSWTNKGFTAPRDDGLPHSATLFDANFVLKNRANIMLEHFKSLKARVHFL